MIRKILAAMLILSSSAALMPTVSAAAFPSRVLAYSQRLERLDGEEIRIAYLSGRVSARELFLNSELDYVREQLADLRAAYMSGTGGYSYAAFDRLPDGASLPELTLENCRIQYRDTCSEYPVLLSYDIGDYILYVGLDLWELDLADAGDIAKPRWHPVTAYFVPESDAVRAPDAVVGDIRIYYETTGDDVRRSYNAVKLVNSVTSYTIYSHQCHYSWAANLLKSETPVFMPAGDGRVIMECDNYGFVVFDLTGELYCTPGPLYQVPYVPYLPEQYGDYIPGSAVWQDGGVTAENENGSFRLTMGSYWELAFDENGQAHRLELPSPVTCEGSLPAVNLYVERYADCALPLSESGCGFYMDGTRLMLTYPRGRMIAFPETLNLHPADGNRFDRMFSNTGIFVDTDVTAVSYYDDASRQVVVNVSMDKGGSWRASAIDLREDPVMTAFIEGCPSAQYIGFTSQNEGWLLLVRELSSMGMGQFSLYRTWDGGISWERVESALTEEHPILVTGAGFADDGHGFICFHNAESPADVWETFDGGVTWSRYDLLRWLPQELQGEESLYASSPVFDGETVTFPLSWYDNGGIVHALLCSEDGGISWESTVFAR